MKVFFKFIVKSMFEKKIRFVLLLFAIAMSTALFIGSMGAVDAGISSFTKPMLEGLEGMEIRIDSGNGGLMDLSEINPKGIKDIRGYVAVQGINQTEIAEIITLYGMDSSWILSKNWIEGNKDESISGRGALISYRTKSELNLEIGDTVEILISGNLEVFTIKGIVDIEGLFYTDSKDQFALVALKESVQEILGIGNLVNRISAKSSMDSVLGGIAVFNENNSSFKAQEILNTEGIEEIISQAKGIFYIMLLIVVLMSSLIIYGSFKLIITERLPVIGTFFSQGATRSDVRKILYLESIFYGVFGGIIGCVIGTGVLYLIHYLVSPLREYGIFGDFSVQFPLIALGMIFSVILPLISCTVPIINFGKLQVKNIILNIEEHKDKKKNIGFALGTILIVFIAASVFFDLEFVIPGSVFMLFGSVIGLILMYPRIVSFLSPVIFKGAKRFNGVLAMGIHNVESSKSLRGNISLLILSILAMVTINSISTSLQAIVVDAFTDMDYDYSIVGIRMQDEKSLESLKSDLRKNPGIVNESLHEIMLGYGKINQTNSLIMGIDPLKYRDFNPYLGFHKSPNREMYDRFLENSSGKVIVSKNTAKLSGVVEGDIISLEINGRSMDYLVAGIVDGKLYFNGSFIMIDNSDLRANFNYIYVDSIYFHTTAGTGIFTNELKEIARSYGAGVESLEEAMEANLRGNRQMMNVLSVFSIISVLIGALGALNNIIISFIQRKRELAMLSSIGMTSGQRSLMILNESGMTVLWAILFITPYGYLLARLITNLTTFIGMPIPVEFDAAKLVPFYLAAFAIFLIATIPVVIKNRKLSVIREIQYE